MKRHTEIRFENAVENALLQNGYAKGGIDAFDSKRALDVVDFV